MVIKPTMRPNKRYVLFKIIGGSVDTKKLDYAIKKSILNLYGEYGSSKSAYKLIEQVNDECIVRFERDFLMKGISALAIIDKLDGTKIRLRSIKTSGTIKRLKQ